MNKSALGMLGALMMMSSVPPVRQQCSNGATSDIDGEPKLPPVPKGCKIYQFDKDGYIVTEHRDPRYSHGYFACVALNERSAIRKFNNYKAKHYGTTT